MSKRPFYHSQLNLTMVGQSNKNKNTKINANEHRRTHTAGIPRRLRHEICCGAHDFGLRCNLWIHDPCGCNHFWQSTEIDNAFVWNLPSP
jgi:hypothetical protein